MMACGCSTRAVVAATGEPVCIVHVGITDGARTVVETPDLTGRVAECSYRHGKTAVSSTDLASFQYRPDEATDLYYCGCWGWD